MIKKKQTNKQTNIQTNKQTKNHTSRAWWPTINFAFWWTNWCKLSKIEHDSDKPERPFFTSLEGTLRFFYNSKLLTISEITNKQTNKQSVLKAQIYKGDPRPRIPPRVMVSSAMGLKLGVFGSFRQPHTQIINAKQIAFKRPFTCVYLHAQTAVDAGDIPTWPRS